MQVLSSSIDLRDVLSWARAFRSGISDEIVLRGSAGVEMSLAGWPPHIDQAGVTTDSAELSAASLRVPAHLGPVEVHYVKNALSFSSPAIVSFGDGTSELYIDGADTWGTASKRKPQTPSSRFHVTGNVAQVRDLVATAGLLGWNLSRGWDVAGQIRCDLLWQRGTSAWQSKPTGFIEWGIRDSATRDARMPDSTLSAPFLNQPVAQIAARVDFKPDATHIALTSTQAFGAHWTGTVDRPGPAAEWQFALSADHLVAADLDRWPNPRSQDSFLDRMLPFLHGRTQAAAVPVGIRASGHISVDEFTLAPLVVRSLEGNLTLGGRHVNLANATGRLYGGTVAGTLDADLQAVPVYRVDADFSHANLSSLLADSPALATLSADSVSGSASFETHGASRSDLLAALTCEGKASVSDFGLSNIDLLGSMRLGNAQPGESAFQDASAAFTCVSGQIRFEDILLEGHNILLGGSGTVDFNRNLDLRLRIVSDDAVGPRQSKSSAAAPGQIYQLSGTLASPQVTPVQPAAPRRVR